MILRGHSAHLFKTSVFTVASFGPSLQPLHFRVGVYYTGAANSSAIFNRLFLKILTLR